MNKKNILAILLVTCFVFGVMAVSASGEVLNVPDPTHVPPITTIQQAINIASPGDTIVVAAGDYTGAVVTKKVEIVGSDGTRIISGVVIPYRPFNMMGYKAGFVLPAPAAGQGDASGSQISNFEIVGNPSDPKFVVGVWSNNTNDASVSHMKISNFLRGINIGGCNGWVITHNNLTNNESGILMFGFDVIGGATSSNNNLIAFNTINSSGVGIYVRAYRGVFAPLNVSNNKIVHNKIIAGDVALELDDDEVNYVKNNLIGFNNFRGNNTEIGYWPDSTILSNNIISRNLGENRSAPKNNPYDPPANIFNPQPPQ